MTVNNGGPEKDIGVVGTFEEGNRIVETTESVVRALELEIQDGVVVKAVAEECGVELEKVVDGFGLVDKEDESVYCWKLVSVGVTSRQWWRRWG